MEVKLEISIDEIGGALMNGDAYTEEGLVPRLPQSDHPSTCLPLFFFSARAFMPSRRVVVSGGRSVTFPIAPCLCRSEMLCLRRSLS